MLYFRNIDRGMTPEELTSVFDKFAMPDPCQGSGISAFAYLRVEEVRIFETDAFALVEFSEVHETIEEIIEELNIYCNSNGLNVQVQKPSSKLKFLLMRRAASAIKEYCGSESLNDIGKETLAGQVHHNNDFGLAGRRLNLPNRKFLTIIFSFFW